MVQSSTVTLDKASKLLDSLLNNIKHLRENWHHLLQESRAVTANLGFETEFMRKRQKRRKKDLIVSQKKYYQMNVFYVAMDAIIGLVLQQFRPSQTDFHSFGMHMSVMTKYTPNLTELSRQYRNDLDAEVLADEIQSMRRLMLTLFKNDTNSLALLNAIYKKGLQSLHP